MSDILEMRANAIKTRKERTKYCIVPTGRDVLIKNTTHIKTTIDLSQKAIIELRESGYDFQDTFEIVGIGDMISEVQLGDMVNVPIGPHLNNYIFKMPGNEMTTVAFKKKLDLMTREERQDFLKITPTFQNDQFLMAPYDVVVHGVYVS